MHRDRSAVTANVLLTPRSAFDGAELFVLGEQWAHAEKLPDNKFRRLLPDRVLRQRHQARSPPCAPATHDAACLPTFAHVGP